MNTVEGGGGDHHEQINQCKVVEILSSKPIATETQAYRVMKRFLENDKMKLIDPSNILEFEDTQIVQRSQWNRLRRVAHQIPVRDSCGNLLREDERTDLVEPWLLADDFNDTELNTTPSSIAAGARANRDGNDDDDDDDDDDDVAEDTRFEGRYSDAEYNNDNDDDGDGLDPMMSTPRLMSSSNKKRSRSSSETIVKQEEEEEQENGISAGRNNDDDDGGSKESSERRREKKRLKKEKKKEAKKLAKKEKKKEKKEKKKLKKEMQN